jgi:putative transposase
MVARPSDRLALHRSRQAHPNRFAESFIGRLRDECLNETLFASLPHARAVLAIWREDYNITRPHSRLGDLTPATCAKLSASGMQRDWTLRSLMGSAPRPAAPLCSSPDED